MKILTTLLFSFCFFCAFGQHDKPKFGKIDPEELKMTGYANDTTADALMLFDYGTTKFILSPQEQFQFEFTRHFRIKIFKKSAFKYADFKFSLYDSGTSKEKITDLKAVTYNLVDGKMVKTRLDNDNIFTEKSNHYDISKFAFPQVKEGSVIELSYTIVSDFLYNLRGWNFQYSIPAVWSQYICEIPEYFNYRQSAKGYLPFEISTHERFDNKFSYVERGETSMGGRTASQTVDFTVNTFRHVLATKDVPAFRSEPNIDCDDNYIQAISYELTTIAFPHQPVKEYSETWASVNDKMKDDEDFGKLLKGDNFIDDTVRVVCNGKSTQVEKATAIYSYLQKNMKWDGSYKLWATRGLKKPYSEHTGSSAEINLLLTLMLRSAGLTADPVMFSTRDNGIAISIFPTITKFNSVLTRVVIDGKAILLDATEEFCPFGYLPPSDINGQGRVVNATGGDWADLDTKLKYTEVKSYAMNILPEGILTGTIQESFDGYAGLNYRVSLKDEKSEEDFFRKAQENTKGLTINGYKITNRSDIYKPVGDSLGVELSDKIQSVGDKILIQPLLLETLETNRYTLEDRKYPVNYNFPISETYLFEYTIPEGYKVESMPSPGVLRMPDGSIAVSYDIRNNGNKINIVYKRTITKILFLPEEYKSLKALYDQIVKKHAENIVLAKSV